MKKTGDSGEKCAALFLLGIVLIFPPVLSIFNVDTLVFGVPLLFIYFIAAWGALIALLARTVDDADEPEAPIAERGVGRPGSGP